YFDDDHARPREAAAAKVIIDRFAGAFPSDVLALENGPPIADPAAPRSPGSTPTLFVEHSEEPSGALYSSAKPRGVFAGVGFAFDAAWLIPGVTKPFQAKATVWRPPRPKQAKGAADPVEGAVYDAMAENAFGQFTRKLLAAFFPKGEPAASTEND
ncbi:MAG TPA: hypothetical protein VGL13_18215, partial [Polyangiaceae bacterium]